MALEDFQLFRQRSLKHDAIIREKYTTTFEIRSVGEQQQEEVEWKSTTIVAACVKTEMEYSNATDEGTMHSMFSQSSNLNTKADDNFVNVTDPNQSEASKHLKAFTCHLCGTELSTQPSLYAHLKEQHSNRGRPHKCSICPATFKRKNHLEEHMACHSGEMRFSCKDCGAHYAKSKSLIRHRQQYHTILPDGEVRNSKNEGQFKCAYCPKSFKHRPSLNFHVKSHYEMLPFVCELCDARFENEKGLQVHKGRYHSMETARKPLSRKALFECMHCPRYFDQQKYLTQHMKFIHPDPCPQEKIDSNPAASEQSQAQTTNSHVQQDEEMRLVAVKTEVEDVNVNVVAPKEFH